MNTELMNQVERAAGSNEKKRLLATADATTREFIRLAVDTYITYGVTWNDDIFVDRLGRMTASSPTSWWESFRELLMKLSRRELTGERARLTLVELLSWAPSRDDYVWATRVLNRDLRSGVSKSIVTKLWPGLIDPFKVSLAETYDPEKHTPEKLGDIFIGPKLDGLRVVILKGIPYSRNGRVLENALPIVEEMRRDIDVDRWVFDGELIDPGETFEGTIGNAKRSGSGEKMVFNCFDVVHLSEWETRRTAILSVRKQNLRDLAFEVRSKRFQIVEEVHLRQWTDWHIQTVLDEYLAAGYEGAMLKVAEAEYVFKRSETVLKVKRFETIDAVITEVGEGKGKHAGRMGQLFIRLPNGQDTKVGSGFDDREREEVWAARDSYVGRTVEVQYQNMTGHDKIRFPTFVRFRPDKD